jgi:branched-chain amino acid transport system permease protein
MNTIQTLIDAAALGSVYALMAVGIGLVFGVLRLVNFAYGQLIMAGAYALALTNNLNPALSILVCFGVVIGLSIAMDVLVFRPLRRAGASPATTLVATFAVSLLLYYIALLKFTVLGKTVGTLTGLNRPIGGGGELIIRWIWVVDIVAAAIALGALTLLLTKTDLGLHMRAAAADFRTARLLGVRANAVIFAAVLLSGVLAAVVAVLMTAETPYVTPDYALRDTIIVLVGVVVGGLDRLWSATLGGFAIGFVTQALAGFLPSSGSWPFSSGVYLDSAVFALVILTLLVRPGGLFVRRGQRSVERV